GAWPGLPPGTPGMQRQRFALAPDDRSLAVVTAADKPGEQTGNQGPQNELWRVSLSGQPPERLARWPARIHDVCWNGKGDAVFIATERGGVHYDLWEVPLKYAEAKARKLTFSQADESSPSVSGDGKQLAYLDHRLGPTMIVVRNDVFVLFGAQPLQDHV